MYSIRHTSLLVYRNVVDTLENMGIKVNFRIITNYFENSDIYKEVKQKVA